MIIILIKITNNNIRNTHKKNIYTDLIMKRKLFIFGGFGFIGLNLNKNLSNRFKITLIGHNNKKYKPKNCNRIISNIFNFNVLNKLSFNESYVVLPILYSKLNKNTLQKYFENLIDLLLYKKVSKIILLSSVSVYGSSDKK